uniref:SKP1 component POZ domain-containing protein n=1 Tax=Ailuropoda melanoleuca TaxID=9646 RepID=G1L923_AILME
VPSVKRQSSDGEVFEADVEIAKQSVTIATVVGDLGMDEGGVQIPNVWLSFFQDDQKSLFSLL